MVVFDLDGTLVDSTPDIALALNSALVSSGGRPLAHHEIVPLIGEGPGALVDSAVTVAGLSGADTGAITRAYLDGYRSRPVVESVLYPGVLEALHRLAAANVTMAVCTNKAEAIAGVVLDRLGIGQFFITVVGGDRITRRKPEPEHLWLALDESKCPDRDEAVLVGDSVIDQRCADAAGVAFLAVPWAPQEVRGERLKDFRDLPRRLTVRSVGARTNGRA